MFGYALKADGEVPVTRPMLLRDDEAVGTDGLVGRLGADPAERHDGQRDGRVVEVEVGRPEGPTSCGLPPPKVEAVEAAGGAHVVRQNVFEMVDAVFTAHLFPLSARASSAAMRCSSTSSA